MKISQPSRLVKGLYCVCRCWYNTNGEKVWYQKNPSPTEKNHHYTIIICRGNIWRLKTTPTTVLLVHPVHLLGGDERLIHRWQSNLVTGFCLSVYDDLSLSIRWTGCINRVVSPTEEYLQRRKLNADVMTIHLSWGDELSKYL